MRRHLLKVAGEPFDEHDGGIAGEPAVLVFDDCAGEAAQRPGRRRAGVAVADDEDARTLTLQVG